MKNLFSIFFIFCVTQAFTQKDSIYIAKWKYDKACAVVFTFDDWSPGHGEIVYPLLKQKGIKATFFLTLKDTVFGGGWDTLKAAQKWGIEIANHTLTHPDLTLLDSASLIDEVDLSQKIIKKHLGNTAGNTFAYPFGVKNKNVINVVAKNHIAARIAGSPYNRSFLYELTPPQTNYYALPTIGVLDVYGKTVINTITKLAIRDGGMLVYMYHSVYNKEVEDKWFQPISEGLLEEHLNTVLNYSSSVWITTLQEAVLYHQTYTNTKLEYITKKNSISVKLSSNKSKSKLTMVIKTSKLIESIRAKGEQIEFRKIGNKFLFDIDPALIQSLEVNFKS